MKIKLLNLTIAVVCGLPIVGFAQGTYLNAPDGNPTNAVVVAPGGNVGIGTTNPLARLEVAGTVKATHLLVGNSHSLAGAYSSITGGQSNTIQASSASSTIGGGVLNAILDGCTHGTIGGGYSNLLQNAEVSTIGGGVGNVIRGGVDHCAIAGGLWNTNAGRRSSIGGGQGNTIQGSGGWSTIGGGLWNNLAGEHSAIGGGFQNSIQWTANDSTIGGGNGNTIGIGSFNCTIAGGNGNTISSNSWSATIGGGRLNTILAAGAYATIPGGYGNTAAIYSMAAGYRAKAIHGGSFVWADVSNVDSDFVDTGNNQFLIRAVGGVGINKNNPAAALDVAGNAIVSGKMTCQVLELTSDRQQKTGFAPVDNRTILDQVARLPLSTWRYTNEPAVRHIGPVAQDFQAAFGVGSDDKHIATVDADGVALASIQALYQLLREKDQEMASLRRQLTETRSELATVRQDVGTRIAALEQSLAVLAPGPQPNQTGCVARETENTLNPQSQQFHQQNP